MRQTSKLGFFFGIFLLLPAAPVNAELFQWTDSRGVIHFTDNFYSVPEYLRGSPQLVVRQDVEITARFSEAPAQAEQPLSEEKRPEVGSPSEPEPSKIPQPIIHYNPQSIQIVVVHSIVRRPKEKRCLFPEGCVPAFRPNFNDRRYIHPSVFNGGPQQHLQPQLFPPDRGARR